jgi:hypothetical protein
MAQERQIQIQNLAELLSRFEKKCAASAAHVSDGLLPFLLSFSSHYFLDGFF